MVVGFPLHGLLASEANVTTGSVSALAGIGNDTRFLQITAPVQIGNSGGPLLDEGGHIVGLVVSKLDAIHMAKATGDIPQNINFAIKGTVAKSFLDSQSVEYETETSSTSLEIADIGAAAKNFTLLLECLR
ncbi:MAG: serine protease [Nitrospirales bacterium]